MILLKWLAAAWLVIAPLVQVNLYPVRNSGVFPNTALLALMLPLAGLVALRNPTLIPWRSRLTVPLIALAVTAVLAGLQGAIFYDRTVAAQHRYVEVQIYAVALIVLSIGAAFGAAIACRSEADVRRFRQLMILCAVLLLGRTLTQPVLPLPLGTLAWWPMMGAHAVGLVTAWLLFEKHQRAWAVVAGIVFVGSILVNVVVLPFLMQLGNQWLSGWIVVSVPIGLLILIRFPRQSLRLLLPALVVFFYWQADNVVRVYHLSYAEGDFGRLTLWQDAIRITRLRPLLGVGPGNYLDYIMRYGQLGSMLSSPHGNYQQIAAEMGLVGLGFAVWLFQRALRLGWGIYRRSKNDVIRSMSIALTCSLSAQFTAAFIGDFVLPNYHNGGSSNLSATIYAWVMMGVLMALERLEPARLGEATPQAEDRDQCHEPGRDPLERQG